MHTHSPPHRSLSRTSYYKILHMNWMHRHEHNRSFSKFIAAKISSFVGSMTFVYLHILWFAAWILIPIEPYPYGLLTMVVSLEAIFLSTFVMINANDAADRDRANADADYQTNIDAKKEIEELAKQLATMESQKLDKILTELNEQNSTRYVIKWLKTKTSKSISVKTMIAELEAVPVRTPFLNELK